MRVNTARSMQLARQVKGRFGTWQAVREAASMEDGAYVLEPRSPGENHDTETTQQAASG